MLVYLFLINRTNTKHWQQQQIQSIGNEKFLAASLITKMNLQGINFDGGKKRYFCWNLVSRLCKEAYLRIYSHLIAPNSNICLLSVLFSGFRYLVLILAKTLLYGLTVLCGITLSPIHCTHVFRVEAFATAAPNKVSSYKLRRQRLSEYFASN